MRSTSPEIRPYVPSTLLDGRFRLECRIAVGPLSEVYRAIDETLGGQVAVKVMRHAADAESLRHLFSEIETACFLYERFSTLGASAVVPVLAFGVTEDEHPRPFLVMPLLRGTTLGHRMAAARAANATFNLRFVAEIVVATADALHKFHEAELVHGDLNPSNLFVEVDGGKISIRVLDLGFARHIGADAPARFQATLLYAATELLLGHPPSASTDVYSLGVILYELLTQQSPWQDQELRTFQDVRNAHLVGGQFPVEWLRAELPAVVGDLVRRMLRRAPDGEPPERSTLAEVRQTLEPYVERVPGASSRPPAPSSPDDTADHELGHVYQIVLNSVLRHAGISEYDTSFETALRDDDSLEVVPRDTLRQLASAATTRPSQPREPTPFDVLGESGAFSCEESPTDALGACAPDDVQTQFDAATTDCHASVNHEFESLFGAGTPSSVSTDLRGDPGPRSERRQKRTAAKLARTAALVISSGVVGLVAGVLLTRPPTADPSTSRMARGSTRSCDPEDQRAGDDRGGGTPADCRGSAEPALAVREPITAPPPASSPPADYSPHARGPTVPESGVP